MPLLSIIIPAYNEEKLLPRCLASVTESMRTWPGAGRSWETIVCDNNSSDRTADIACAQGVRVVHEPINQIARARNCGASAAVGDWLLFLDADSLVSAGLMEELALTITSGWVLGGGATVQMEDYRGSALFWVRAWNRLSRLTSWAPGGFLFCERRAFADLGGFSEELYISEEIDFSRRMKRLARRQGRQVRILSRHPLLTSPTEAALVFPIRVFPFCLALSAGTLAHCAFAGGLPHLVRRTALAARVRWKFACRHLKAWRRAQNVAIREGLMESDAFQWLRTGDAAYAAMLQAMERARKTIRLETYTYAPGGLGEKFREAAVRACQRGVAVKVLVDALGSLNLPDAFWEPLRQAGGQFRWFNPLNLKRLTFRDHRKVLVCDEAVAFVGGFNIAPEYEGDGVARGWRDVGLCLQGGLAAELAHSFELLFSRADFEHQAFTRFRRAQTRQAIAAPLGDLLLSGPGRGRNTIKRALMDDLTRGRDIRIAAAYFVPTGRLRRALVRAARRGGTVQLILPAKSDVPLAQLASRVYYRQLLRAGVELYEYQPQVLHSKLLVIDHACYVGSSNLDARSLHINYELMLRLTHTPLVREARGIFSDHLAHSRRVDPEAWRAAQTFWSRLREGWAHFLLARLDPLIMRIQLQRDRVRRRAAR